MLVLALSAIAVLSPLVAGRWPAGLLVEHRWRLVGLVWLALALQVVAFTLALPGGLVTTLHLLTYAAAAGFLWANRRLSGAWIIGAGALANGVTIALNGGVLPASAGAMEAAGIDPAAVANVAVLDHPILPWLGDVFAWPAPLPLANTFSVGDVLIVVGAFVAAWTGTRRIGAPPPDREPARTAPTEPTA